MQIGETIDSGEASVSDGRLVRRYKVKNEWNQSVIEAYFINFAVVFHRGRFRQDIQLHPQGGGVTFVDVIYGPMPRYPGSCRINFDTTGGSARAFVSKELVNTYKAPGETCPWDGSIGKAVPLGIQADDTIEGLDIQGVPLARRSYTFTKEVGVISESVMDYYELWTGQVNSKPWHNRRAGEVLFLGVTGSTVMFGSTPQSDITFNMAMSVNADGSDATRPTLTIGEISNIVKKGHHYLEVHWKPSDSGGKPSKEADYVKIQRVFDECDFAQRLGF